METGRSSGDGDHYSVKVLGHLSFERRFLLLDDSPILISQTLGTAIGFADKPVFLREMFPESASSNGHFNVSCFTHLAHFIENNLGQRYEQTSLRCHAACNLVQCRFQSQSKSVKCFAKSSLKEKKHREIDDSLLFQFCPATAVDLAYEYSASFK